MTNSISAKLAALAVALTFNGLMIGGIAYLFNGQIHDPAPVTSSVLATAPLAGTI